MPLAGVERPSIALGLLKAILTRDGIPTRVFYPNMWFLEHVGMKDYRLLDSIRTEEAIVDWLFGGVAFPDFQPDHDAYLAQLFARNPGRHLADTAGAKRRLLQLRAQMTDFVDWTVAKILAAQPRIVGCTSTFQQHVASLALLRRIKEIDPTIVTIMGGANCETIMGRTTMERFPWVDFIASGEADRSISPLFRRILAEGPAIPAEELPLGILGPSHRATGFPAIAGGDGVPRATTEQLNDLPAPDYDDYFTELSNFLYREQLVPGIPVETSRGCWWGQRSHCTFCGLNGGGMAFRVKTPEKALDEISQLVGRYGVRRVEAVDNILDMGYFDTVLPELAALPEPLNIFFETKANLKRWQVEQLAKAGIRWIQPGIESMHTGVLKLMRKGSSAWQNVQLLRWGRQFGVRISWNLICGFPGEQDEWYAEMASWMPSLVHLQPGAVVTLRYDRYSPYFRAPETYGLKLQPSRLYRYAYPLSETDLANQVYFFEDTALPEDAHGSVRRPGLAALRRVIGEWLRAWGEAELPKLLMRDEAGVLVVTDTRPCASAAERRLSGVSRALLLASEESPSASQLRQQLASAGHPEEEIDTAIEELAAARLILELDGRIVPLPLWEPYTLMPSTEMFPGGYLRKVEVAMLQSLVPAE
jgi:ribosomal peptide maturation radical SAM protein 1